MGKNKASANTNAEPGALDALATAPEQSLTPEDLEALRDQAADEAQTDEEADEEWAQIEPGRIMSEEEEQDFLRERTPANPPTMDEAKAVFDRAASAEEIVQLHKEGMDALERLGQAAAALEAAALKNADALRSDHPCPACLTIPQRLAFTRGGVQWYECERCGTVATKDAAILPELQRRADAMEAGEALEIARPFRAMRRTEDLATAADIAPEMEYLLSESGAYLAGITVGLRYLTTMHDQTIIFIKE